MSDYIIAAIREYRVPAGLDADDAAVVVFTLELLRPHRVSDVTFEALRSCIGYAGVVDLLVLSGYYCTLAHFLQVLEVDLLEGMASVLTY